jgi:hypothetical protein
VIATVPRAGEEGNGQHPLHQRLVENDRPEQMVGSAPDPGSKMTGPDQIKGA